MLNNFLIVVPTYNSEKFIRRCLDSILNQDYKNFDIVVVDDYSFDGTADIINAYEVVALFNTEHLGSSIANIKKGIKYLPGGDNDIIVIIDGDDYLENNHVLSYLNKVYTPNIWLTYGQYISLSGKFKNICQPLNAVNTTNFEGERTTISLNSSTYRKSRLWVTSHLKTFRRFLWDKIKDDDLRNMDGEYFKTCCDVCTMFPMVEMAGDEHIKYIDKILYVYDDMNNNYGMRAEENMKNFDYLVSKPSYNKI